MADDTPTSRFIITAEISGTEKVEAGAKRIADANEKLSQSAIKATEAVNKQSAAIQKAGNTQGAGSAVKQAVADAEALISVTTRLAVPSREAERVLVRVANAVDPLGEKARRLGTDIEKLGQMIGGGGERAQRAVSLMAAATQKLTELQQKAAGSLLGAASKAGDDAALVSANRIIETLKQRSTALAAVETQEKQLRTAITASNAAELERVRISNLARSVRRETSVTEAVSRVTGAGAAPSESALKLRNQLILESEKALSDQIERNRLIVEKAGDAYVPYAAKIRIAQGEVDELNRIVKEGGNNAMQASSIVVAAQKNLDALRQKQIQAIGGDQNEKLSAGAEKYLNTLNPLLDVQSRYRTRISEVNELTRAGLVTNTQAIQLLGNFAEKEQKVTEAIKTSTAEQLNSQQIAKRFGPILQGAQKDFTDYNSTATRVFGLNRIGLLELQAAGVNTFQALASGMSLTHVATMEGAQAFGAFVQGGLGIRTLLSIVAPIAAVSAAMLILVHRISTVRTNIREFDLSLSTVASGSGQTAQGLQKIVEHFKDLGVSADDAKKSVNEVLKEVEKGINPNRTQDIIQTALNIQAVPTTANAGNLPETTKALTDALTGGIPALTEYGLRLKALTAADVEQVRELAKHAGAPAAVQAAYEKIDTFFAGKHKESMSASKDLWVALRNAWGDFVDSVAESDFATAIVDNLEKSVKAVTRFITSLDSYYNWLQSHQGVIGGLLDKIFPKEGLLGPVGRKIDELLNFEKGTGTKTTDVTVPVQKPTVESTATETNRLSIRPGVNLGTSNEIKQLTDMLGKAIETFPAGYKAIVSSASRPGATVADTGEPSLHGVGGGRAVDVKIVGPEGAIKNMGTDPTGMYKKLETAVAEIQKRDYPELSGKMQFGTTFRKTDAGHIGIEGERGRDTTAANDNVVQSNQRVTASFNEREKKIREDLNALGLWNVGQAKMQARLEAERAELAKGSSQIDVKRAGDLAAAEAGEKLSIEWGKQGVVAREAAEGAQLTATAFQESEVAGLKAAAMAEAYNLELTTGVPALQTYGQIITRNAVESVLGAQKEVAAFGQVLTANKRLADATKEGTAAAKDAELQNEAARSTHDALNNAIVLGNKALEDRARRLQEEKLEQLKANEALVQTTDLERQTNLARREAQSLSLQTGLTAGGATREQIDKEVNNLRAIQLINNENASASKESKESYVSIVNSTGEWRIKLAAVELSQRRINDTILDIADTIGTSLTDRLEDAFDGKKAKDWGETVKDVLKDIIKSASDKLFIKPLLGTIADSLGFSSVSQSLGTFGGSAIGATGALATGNTGTGTSTGLVTSKAGTTTTTSAGIGGSTSTGLLGLGSITGSTGSVTNWLNNTIGPALGFAKPASTVSTGGLTLGELSDLGIESGTTGILGSTSLTEAVGGIGIGVGAGALTSSLTGGNTTTGSIVGGAGGLAGTLIGGPVGGAIGGALGGVVGGLFGNNKTSNNAAGANLDLGSLKISGTVSSKDEASNQDVEDITGSVRSFARDLAKETGGTIGGSISVQSGLRDGIKVGFAGSLSNLGEVVYESAQDAIDDIELQIAKNLEGLSDTAKTVLDQLVDPADIQDALDFADAYDNLKTASDEAFAGIDADTDLIGPYAEAMDLLVEKFDDLTVSAEEFGLSLDPITKGLDEATKRLQEDFGKSLDAALDASAAQDFLTTLQDVSDAFVSNTKEAKAIGLDTDTATTTKIAQLEVSAARETLDTLSSEDLQTVVDDLAETAPEISKLAQSLIDLGGISSDATDFISDLNESLNLSRGEDFINTLQSVSDAFVDNIQKADELGLNDTDTALKIAQTEVEAAKSTLDTLSKSELRDVIDALGDSAPEIADMAQSILDLGTASDDASDSIVKLADGIKSIKDLASDLRTGKLSGLTDTSAARSAIKEYNKDLAAAQTAGANVTGNQLDKLAESGTAAIDASLKAYGNAPKTADLRRQVLSDLDAILSVSGAVGKSNVVPIPTKVANTQWDIFADTLKTGASTDIPSAVAAEQTIIRDDTLAAAAGGSMGTKPGRILVGEKGPEWMLPGYANGTRWMKVGMHGPEIINQSGGAMILPFPMHPKNLPGYADGTDFGLIPEPGATLSDPTYDSNNSGSMDNMVIELRGLRRDNRSMKDELAALKRQIQGGQTQATVDARKGNSTLSSINNKLGSGLTTVTRRAVG